MRWRRNQLPRRESEKLYLLGERWVLVILSASIIIVLLVEVLLDHHQGGLEVLLLLSFHEVVLGSPFPCHSPANDNGL